jgi:hypothetical protein
MAIKSRGLLGELGWVFSEALGLAAACKDESFPALLINRPSSSKYPNGCMIASRDRCPGLALLTMVGMECRFRRRHVRISENRLLNFPASPPPKEG